MRIVTSCWFTPLPDNYKRISTSRGTPRNQPAGFRVYKPLQPGPWFNSCASNEEFKSRYFEILGQLKADKVIEDLVKLSDGKVPALLCWEPPTHTKAWCHRALISIWLETELGLHVCEYGHEHEGWGWAHPKLPPEFRLKPLPAAE